MFFLEFEQTHIIFKQIISSYAPPEKDTPRYLKILKEFFDLLIRSFFQYLKAKKSFH